MSTPLRQKMQNDMVLRGGCDVDGLKVLHVPNFRPTAKAFRVDLEKQVLVEAPLAVIHTLVLKARHKRAAS